MKNKKNRRYPIEVFILGFFMSLFRYSLILIISIILFVIRLFITSIPIIIPVIIAVLWILTAFIDQCILRKTALESDHEAFDEMLTDNGKSWRENIREMVDRKINEAQNEEKE